MITRFKTRKYKPKAYLVHSKATISKQALAQPEWLKFMEVEYYSLIKNDTWFLTLLSPHRNTICCKWVFKVKENSDGSINKYKARLVAKEIPRKT